MRRTATTDGLYFVTLTVVDWVDVFTRAEYKQYLVENLAYCQEHKGLEIFAYVIMTNHVHLIGQTTGGTMSDLLRDFKSFTSKGLFQLISDNPRESRRDWMRQIFIRHGNINGLNKEFQVWQNGNHPTLLSINLTEIIQQKVDYIHNNPVRAGIVSEAGMYLYSSAHPQNPLSVYV